MSMNKTALKVVSSISLDRNHIPVDDTTLKLGRILGSLVDYRIESESLISINYKRDKIGAGGYGIVWLGEVPLDNDSKVNSGGTMTKVAVKALHQVAMNKVEYTLRACRFAQELKVWAGLMHRNTLKLIAFYLNDALDTAWLLSPYEPKGNLAEFLTKEIPSEERKMEVFDTVSGLRYLHSHNPTIVHGDLKPANVIIGGDGFAKLCDFGLARALEDPTELIVSDNSTCGTTRYMSPELLLEENPVRTLESDIWALGCLVGEVLTGQVPYHPTHLDSTIVMKIITKQKPILFTYFSPPTELVVWIWRCWKHEASKRSSASDCVYSLKRYMEIAFPESSRLHQVDDPLPSTTKSQTDDFFVGLHRDKLKKQGIDHPDYTTTLKNLAFTLTERFDNTGAPEDLEEAIALHRRALQRLPEGYYERCYCIRNLAVVLCKRFKLLGDPNDLDECIKLRREALSLCPPGHPEHPIKVFRLAAALSVYCKRWINRGASDECVNLYREAHDHHDVKHPDYLPRLQGLAGALQDRFELFGDVGDLEESVELHREAFGLCPNGHPKRLQAIESLAFALLVSSRASGDVRDAGAGVELWRELLELQPMGNPNHHKSLHKLGWALQKKFVLLGEERDLEEAINVLREAHGLYGKDDPNRYLICGSLGGALCSNFQRCRDPQDLIEAVKLLREADRLLKPGDFGEPEILESLGTALAHSYQSGGDAKDIDEAIKVHLKALELCPGHYPFRYDRLVALGKSLRCRGGTSALAEAKQCYQEALELVPGDYPGNLRRQKMVKALLDEVEVEMAQNDQSTGAGHAASRREGVALEGSYSRGDQGLLVNPTPRDLNAA